MHEACAARQFLDDFLLWERDFPWMIRLPAAYNRPMEITLTELEEAINYWRLLRPSLGEESALSPEVNALASGYAMMIFNDRKSVSLEDMSPQARQLIESWRQQAKTAS